MWYWRYKIKYYAENKEGIPELKVACGVVIGKTIVNAVSSLTEYYGDDNIADILTLRAICEDVLDFENADEKLRFIDE